MLESVSLDRGLCLPAVDIAALLQGQIIAALPRFAVQRGWTFLLCPYVDVINSIEVKQAYRSSAFSLVKATSSQQSSESTKIEAWARCEYLKMLHEVDQLEALSSLSIWTKDSLSKALQQRQHLFLAILRVYKLPKSVEVQTSILTNEKVGKFTSLAAVDQQLYEPIKVTQLLPVLDDFIFEQRKQQLEELRPLIYTGLESLLNPILELATTNTKAKSFADEVKAFLGWTRNTGINASPDLTWIKKIAAVGNSSDGDQFEKLVRKSFNKLGFENSNSNPYASLDPDGCGGAGGLDFYCEKPYPIVGECKATKTETVPDGTPAQLVKLGLKHLPNLYNDCIKVIMAAGELNAHAKQVASGNQMNVLRPETLQRLLELKAAHEGSIDLLALEPCLKEAPFGEAADAKVNHYIDKIFQDLELRSNLVQIVKQLTQTHKKQIEVVQICSAYNLTVFGLNNQSAWLDNQTVYELLIELSSPLAGYLGRLRAGSLNSDRFYYLRDLPVE